MSNLHHLFLLAFAFQEIQKLGKSLSEKAMTSVLTSMPYTMIKPNGRNHTISSLKGLIRQTQLVLLLTAKSAILIRSVLGLEEKEFVLEMFSQTVQQNLLSLTSHRCSI